MQPHEIQAKAAIAAALIASGKFDVGMANLWEHEPSGHVGVSNLVKATDVIYRALTNLK